VSQNEPISAARSELTRLDLEPQEEAFAIEYVSNGFDHREAARKCGYSPSAGVRLKRKPAIQNRIASLLAEMEVDSIVNRQVADTILDRLEDIAMGEVPVAMVTKDGEEFEARKFFPELAMKVYQERVRLHKLVQENSKGSVNVQINMGDLIGESPAIEVKVEDPDG